MWQSTLPIRPVDFNSNFLRNYIPAVFEDVIQIYNPLGAYHPLLHVEYFWWQSLSQLPQRSCD